MSSSNIDSMRNAYPGESDHGAAGKYAEKYGYLAIIAYKATMNSKDFTTIGCCQSEEEIGQYLDNCIDAISLYDGRSTHLIIQQSDLEKATCFLCNGKNELFFCPNCGKYYCMDCYQNEIPLTEEFSGYGMCTTCDVEVQKAFPGDGGKIRYKSLPISNIIKRREEKPVSDEELDKVMRDYLASVGEPITSNEQDNFYSNDSLSESNNHVTKSQNWYFVEDQQKNVRQIITHEQNMEYHDSEFSSLALSGKYENLMSQKWTCGYFRTDDKPGPYLLVRADGHINYLKDCPIRIAFSFYREPSAGLFGLFVAADTIEELKKVSPHGYAVFECIFGLDDKDAVQRIEDALSKEKIRLCFADKSESLSQEVMDENGNFIEMSPPCCQFDKIFKIDDKCRQLLLKEFKALIEYHETTNCDFQSGLQELSADFPPSDYPILSQNTTKNSLSEKENTIPKQKIELNSEEDELYQCEVCQTSWNKQDIGEYLFCPDCNGRLSYSQSENEIEYANINNKPTSSKKQFISNSKAKSNMVNLLFSFNGRILRSDYWLRGALVLGMVTSLINISVLLVYLQTTDFMLGSIIQICTAIVILWPVSALWTKRLHDRGRSGKLLLFILIPFIGQIYFIWLVIQICFLPGDQKPNQFGPVPVPEMFSSTSKFLRIGIVIVLTLANMLMPFLKIETMSEPITPVVVPLFGISNNIEVTSPEDTPED